jgi:hypothetical protein
MLKKLIGSIVGVGLLSMVASASYAWDEPARGTADRSELMDAIRPHIEWSLGSPIEFVIDQLRVSGNVAFASLAPQRPGGTRIALNSTPGYLRGEFYLDQMDGTSVSVLYRKLRNTWVAVHFDIGATDVWFASPDYCSEYKAVIPEFC